MNTSPLTLMTVHAHPDDESLSNGGVLVVPPGAVAIANEWAAKVGAGYRFNDMIGSLQLYGIYERMRREHTVAINSGDGNLLPVKADSKRRHIPNH